MVYITTMFLGSDPEWEALRSNILRTEPRSSESELMKRIFLLITVALLVSSCANVVRQPAQGDYAEVYRHAYMALQEEKWLTYKQLMRVVIDKSTASGAPPEQRAIFWYEYGRAAGVVCDWKDAEFAMTVAKNIDTKVGGPSHESLGELGRMSVVRKQYDKAVGYFTLALQEFTKYQEENPDKKITNQLGNARVIEDYAYALEQAGGQQADVDKLREKAAEIREKFTGQEGAYESVTPYGTQCSS
ncbi:hypothetical protein HW090_10330 [Pseudomonas sp. ABC1]|uniref:hypothetical protein n=1 Tax=Pseudomonas sp. ABC1 TaxID=2748080 RepID=UPI0015C32095|nr:hypothetical protein [Pseudomonas sp. ABC1]QLF93567.1 hypothetical protein HW090_10330 [Pseudomonas sp. ABC1]